MLRLAAGEQLCAAFINGTSPPHSLYCRRMIVKNGKLLGFPANIRASPLLFRVAAVRTAIMCDDRTWRQEERS